MSHPWKALRAYLALQAAFLLAAVASEPSDVGQMIVTKLGASAPIGKVLTLDPDNFSEHVAGEVSVFVEFFAPWCGHCKKIKPIWADLAVKLLDEPALKFKTIVAAVNADEHKELGNEYGVTSYPTFIHFPPANSSQLPMQYNGGHQLGEFVNFLKQRNLSMLSSRRAASKVFALDVLAWKFRHAKDDGDVQKDMMERMEAVAGSETAPESMRVSAAVYLKLMEKSLKAEDFDAFFDAERDRLDRLLQSGQLSDEKLKDVTARREIIQGFIKEPLLPGGVAL